MTIEQILQHRNDAEPQSIASCIDQYCLSSAIARQHRSKIRLQASLPGADYPDHRAATLLTRLVVERLLCRGGVFFLTSIRRGAGA